MIKNFKEYNTLFESDNLTLDIQVENINNELIDKVIDKLSFVYKKRKEKYVRPINITGSLETNNIKLDILLSNKDKIRFSYKNNNELKIKINGDVLYHMDDIKDSDFISKVYNVYSKFLKDNNFKISKKDNPFESLSNNF